MKTKSKILLVYLFSLGGIITWLGAIFFAPYLKSESLKLNGFFYALFSPVCHQIPSRSFFLFGYPLAVCARCLGIYFGFLAGTFLYPFLNGFSSLSLPRSKLFVAVSFPIGIDTLGNFLHAWATSNWMRFAFGFSWGLILPFYFIFGLADLYLNLTHKNKKDRKKMPMV